jgi:predicted dehydrogenase
MGEYHLATAKQLDTVEVVAVCDIRIDRCRELAGKYAVAAAYSDLEDMLSTEVLDGVIIATPDAIHLQPSLAAAEAGIHILLEKPMATTVADAEAILTAVEAAGVKLMLGHIARFVPEYKMAHDKVASGELGMITNAYLRRSCTLAEGRRLAGRCSVNEYLAPHDFDLLLWYMGKDVTSVYATKGDFVLKPEYGVADYYWNVIKFANGASGVVHVAWCEPDTWPRLVEAQLMLNGTQGCVHTGLGHVGSTRSATESGYETPLVSAVEALANEITAFVDCIRLDRDPPITGIDGLNTVKLLVAAEESVRTGLPVEVAL